MKKNALNLNVLLAAVVGTACLALMLARVFAPMSIPPKIDLTMMLGLSLIALTIEAYWGPAQRYTWPVTVVLGGVTFALMPCCPGARGWPEQSRCGSWAWAAPLFSGWPRYSTPPSGNALPPDLPPVWPRRAAL